MTLELKNVAKRVGADMHIHPTNLALERGSFNVTFSAGVASMSGLKSSRELVFAADRALYDAKNRGRNRVVLWSGTVAEGSG